MRVKVQAILGEGLYSAPATCTFRINPPVPYLAADGTTQTCLNYTVLTGSEGTLAAGWYVADGTISFDHQLNTSGDFHLILKDGAVMNIGTEGSPASGYGIYANEGCSISIHGQSTGEHRGQLWINATDYGIYTDGGNVVISGGEVHARGSGDYFVGIYAYKINNKGGSVSMTNAVVTAEGKYGIYSFRGGITLTDCKVTATSDFFGIIADSGDLEISGGQVTATGTSYYGIAANNITLSWTAPTDFISANSYRAYNGGTITLAKAFTDGDGNIYSGIIDKEEDDIYAINGKKLLPYIGDANGDYVVTIADVVMVVSYLVNGQEPEGFNFDQADVDGNATVDTTDLRAIVDMILEE